MGSNRYFGPLANSLDASGSAPLHVAAYFGHRITCERLLQLGADVNLIDGDGLTPFDHAREGQMKCTMATLALNGATAHGAEELAARYVAAIAARKNLPMPGSGGNNQA